MKTFESYRFLQLLKWSLLTEKKQYVKYATSLFIVYFLIIAASAGIFTGYRNPVDPYSIGNAAMTCLVAWMIAGGILTSELFSVVRTKQQRIAFLMLPATNCEKYWSRIAVAVLQSVVLSTVMLAVADMAQMIVSFVFSQTGYSIWPRMFVLDGNDTGSALSALSMFTTCLWCISSYILGGTVFRKMPVILTTLSWTVFWIVFGIGVASVGAALIHNVDFFRNYEIEFWMDFEDIVKLALACVGTTFTALNMWFSYRTFSRMDINSSKILNI